MKLQKSYITIKPSYLTQKLRRTQQEHQKLNEKLFEATNKQHQEMYRAIELSKKNTILKKELAKVQEAYRIASSRNSNNATRVRQNKNSTI